MKNEKLLNAMGQIDDELILDAARNTKKRKSFIRWGGLAAVMFLCAGTGILGFRLGALNRNSEDTGITNPELSEAVTPDTEIPDTENPVSGSENVFPAENSVVILDVNPSIALTVDTEEKIVDAMGLNEDGRNVLSEMDLTGVDITVAVNAIIGSMLQKGYLSDLQNAILVSVDNEDAEISAALQERVSALIGNALQNGNLEGTVLSQTLDDTAGLELLAQNYHISLGKAALIQEVMVQDQTLTVEKLAPLSITEIALISQSKNLSSQTLTQNGAASDKAYISREDALAIACSHANADINDITLIKVEFDSEDGIMVYEIEFLAGTTEFDCDIDARTGEIVKYKAENKTSSGTQQADYIGEEAAKIVALTNAGISEDSLSYINAWMEYDDGCPEHYQVEFATGTAQYCYKIDLCSGGILKHEMHHYGRHGAGDHSHNGTHDGVLYPVTDIGEEAAIAAALSHAGLNASEVRKLKAKYDYEDDIAIYEVEFEYQEFEYEYEIDAATGTILKYEIDD